MDATLAHKRGELAVPPCSYCTAALGVNPGRRLAHFQSCVVLSDWLSGGYQLPLAQYKPGLQSAT